jgi:hypothetical protein
MDVPPSVVVADGHCEHVHDVRLGPVKTGIVTELMFTETCFVVSRWPPLSGSADCESLAQTEDDLINKIATMFGDAMMVRCVPSDYAKSVITKVREFDRAKTLSTIDAMIEASVCIDCGAPANNWRTPSEVCGPGMR